MAVLFAGVLYSSDEVFFPVSRELKEIFGNTILESPPLPWDYTDYYVRELENPVHRRFLFFGRDVDASSIIDAKLKTMSLETKFSKGGKRQINIDPGYMTLAKVVLASRKNYSHRIYLGRGVFGEVELFHKAGRFNALSYTYPDYRDQALLEIFSKARALLKRSFMLSAGKP